MKSVDQYQKNGYLILRGFFSHTDMAELGDSVDRVYHQWVDENETDIYKHMLVNMHSLTSPEYFVGAPEARVKFFNAIASLKLITVLEDMFGSGIYFHNTQLFFNPLNHARLPYWHRDLQYSSIAESAQRAELNNMLSLHIRIPLLEEKGIEVVSGSHKRWDTDVEHNVRLERNGHKNSESLPNATLIDLAPGDIVIFSAQMIHRGNYVLNTARKALDLCVGKYHPLISGFLDEAILPTPEELAGITHHQWYTLALKIAADESSR